MTSSIATIAINDVFLTSRCRKDGGNRYAMDENNRTFLSAKLVITSKPGFGILASYDLLLFQFQFI